MLSVRGKVNKDGSFDWREALADAGLIAGFTFFSTLASINITKVVSEPVHALCIAGVSAAVQFFATLTAKRGLIRK